jgi:chloramphenicol O-acetyltransferase type A
MNEFDMENSSRYNTYTWFKSFSNSTYGVNVKLDVTKIVKLTKERNELFFINFLFIILKGLNNTPEMRMRLIDDKPYIFDDINPAFTVMTKAGTFENVRLKNNTNYQEFYKAAKEVIEESKNKEKIIKCDYNPTNMYNEYYITCTPWLDFVSLTHPIPDDKSSQTVPRVCWGKFIDNNGKYELTLNITVSHIFVDGYPLSQTFLKIQELLDNCENILK